MLPLQGPPALSHFVGCCCCKSVGVSRDCLWLTTCVFIVRIECRNSSCRKKVLHTSTQRCMLTLTIAAAVFHNRRNTSRHPARRRISWNLADVVLLASDRGGAVISLDLRDNLACVLDDWWHLWMWCFTIHLGLLPAFSSGVCLFSTLLHRLFQAALVSCHFRMTLLESS